MDFRDAIERFIAESGSDHARKIDEFKRAGRKNVKFKSGDFSALSSIATATALVG